MRISRVKIKNFRPYRYQEITFYKNPTKKDLFIVYGITGKGKSTFLDAIHWALYGSEFQTRGIGKDENSMLNKARLMEMEDGDKDYVEVMIEIESTNGRSYIKRRAEFIKKNGVPNKISEEVEFVDEDGVVYTDPSTVSGMVNGFIPERVKNFFFMDGESLTSRFFSESSRALAEEIREMAQLDIVDDAISKMREVKKMKEREYAKGNGSLEIKMNEKIKIEEEIHQIKERLEMVSVEIRRLRNEIEELRRQLAGIPDVSELQKKRAELTQQLKKKEEQLQNKIQQKREYMLKYGAFVLFDESVDELVSFLESIDPHKSMPVVTNEGYLQLSLKKGFCALCGQPLTPEACSKIEADLQKLKTGKDFIKHRSQFISHAEQIKERKQEFLNLIANLNTDIANLREDIASIEREINMIDRTLVQYDAEEIAKKWQRLSRAETYRDEMIAERTRLETKLSDLQQKYDTIIKEIEVLMVEEDQRAKLKKEIDFLERLIQLAERLRKEVKEDIRREIESEAESLFKQIVWNPENFDRLEVDETFGVKVYHKGTNLDVTYELSGGQSKILAMAFTIALHKVIRYNSPIIIDRPIVNISGEKLLRSMVKMFAEVASDKQVILLLTPDELPDHLKKDLETYASSVWAIENNTGNEARFVRESG